jgi:type I restriction enzyme M protein
VTLQATATQESDARPAAVFVQQGKLLDFIDGITQRNETPEEYVRQEISKFLVREYGYAKSEVSDPKAGIAQAAGRPCGVW